MRVRNCNRFTVPPASQSFLIGPERSGCGNSGSVYLEVWAIVCVARIQKTPLSGLRRKQELSICCCDSFHSKTLRGTSESIRRCSEATISCRGGISHRLESYRRKLEADCGKDQRKVGQAQRRRSHSDQRKARTIGGENPGAPWPCHKDKVRSDVDTWLSSLD
jgi:hypothetical protein